MNKKLNKKVGQILPNGTKHTRRLCVLLKKIDFFCLDFLFSKVES